MAVGSDEQVLMIHGEAPVIAGRLDYLRDPAFDGLAEPNPFFIKPELGAGRERSHGPGVSA
jgi:type IV secretory pathway TraG/TraD family ATPase VirD4